MFFINQLFILKIIQSLKKNDKWINKNINYMEIDINYIYYIDRYIFLY